MDRRDASVSGDMNPLHLSSLAARALVSPAVVRGMWTKAHALGAAGSRLPSAYAWRWPSVCCCPCVVSLLWRNRIRVRLRRATGERGRRSAVWHRPGDLALDQLTQNANVPVEWAAETSRIVLEEGHRTRHSLRGAWHGLRASLINGCSCSSSQIEEVPADQRVFFITTGMSRCCGGSAAAWGPRSVDSNGYQRKSYPHGTRHR
jgi:hypothetical protein